MQIGATAPIFFQGHLRPRRFPFRHGDTPSSHLNFNGIFRIFHEINHPAIAVPRLWKPSYVTVQGKNSGKISTVRTSKGPVFSSVNDSVIDEIGLKKRAFGMASVVDNTIYNKYKYNKKGS